MGENQKLINVKCPMCDTTLVTVETGKQVNGLFQHKCNKCKRFWRIDYTSNIVKHLRGKVDKTTTKIWTFNPETGESIPKL